MRELFRPGFVVPALILAEVCVPFSTLVAPTVYWFNRNEVVVQIVSLVLGLVLIAYVLVESIRFASLLLGAIAGLWAAVSGLWPTVIVGTVARNAIDAENGIRGLSWTGNLAMVPHLLATAGIGLAAGLLFSLIPWLLHRREPSRADLEGFARPTGWLLAVTWVMAFMPLLAALGATRTIDWFLRAYAGGVAWGSGAQTFYALEVAIRLVLLVLAAAAAGSFLLRRPSGPGLAVALLVLAIAAALFRLATRSQIPLTGADDWRQLQGWLDVVELIAAVLASVLGIPCLLRTRQRWALARESRDPHSAAAQGS